MFNTREATDCLYIQALKFPFSCENVTEYSTKVVSGKLTPMRQRQPTLLPQAKHLKTIVCLPTMSSSKDLIMSILMT